MYWCKSECQARGAKSRFAWLVCQNDLAEMKLVDRTLFVDGYDSNGDRIYDRLNGLTCHQCRQKTIGLRTKCSCCDSLKVTSKC